ncbi:hypothetical protein MASR2M17_24190 [Aminivibrio sp.]
MITVKRLLSLPVFRGSSIIAGENGLDHIVQYVDVAEVPDVNFWINPNVFVLTTAYAFCKDSDSLMKLIEALIENKAAGLGIKLGRFLNVLPREVVDFAERSNFSIILLPPELRYTHAIRAITESILQDEHNNSLSENLDDAFSQILFGSGDSAAEAQMVFEKAGFSSLTPVAVISAIGSPAGIEKSLMPIRELAQRHGNLSAIVAVPYGTAILVRTFSSLQSEFSGYSSFFSEGVYAVASEEAPLKKVRRSYDTTLWGARLLRLFNYPKGIYSAEETSLFFPLLSDEYRDKSTESAQNVLRPLIDYDCQNNASLVETLWMFALCGCDHNKTAERLHIHRNTLRYRLSKIEHLLPKGSLRGASFHRLFLALTLHLLDCA